MTKKERLVVLITGIILLAIFTFTDLQISLAIAKQPVFARVLEVIGEIPFTLLTITACAIIIKFRSKTSTIKNILTLIGIGFLFLMFSAMGGFMTGNYLSRNIGPVHPAVMIIIGILMAAVGILIAAKVPEANRRKALDFAVTALFYFLLVIIIMNMLKATWGRMRFREMTDPLAEFTRWYEIQNRGGFSDIYASFPSGHSMQSAGVILLITFPGFMPLFKGKEKGVRIFAYIWALLVGSSRVFMGAHFASDVTAGIMLSLFLFEIVRIVVERIRRHAPA